MIKFGDGSMNYLSKAEIESYIQQNGQYFESSVISTLRNALANSGLTLEEINIVKFKSPTVGRLLSVFLGIYGVDRFYAENYLLGILKACTLGGLCILWIRDWTTIDHVIKENNFNKLLSFLTGENMESSSDMNKIKIVVNSKEGREAIRTTVKTGKDFFDSFSDGM